MIAHLVEELTESARFFGALLGLQLCDLTKENPEACAVAPAPGVAFEDVATLEALCDALRLDLSLAHASSEDGRMVALRLRRAQEREVHGCPTAETADRVRVHRARPLSERSIPQRIVLPGSRRTIGGGVLQRVAV